MSKHFDFSKFAKDSYPKGTRVILRKAGFILLEYNGKYYINSGVGPNDLELSQHKEPFSSEGQARKYLDHLIYEFYTKNGTPVPK